MIPSWASECPIGEVREGKEHCVHFVKNGGYCGADTSYMGYMCGNPCGRRAAEKARALLEKENV